MDEIKQWLASEGSYFDGLALMAQHSKNRAMIHHLSRKEDRSRLRYQLEKLVGVVRPVVAVVAAPTPEPIPEVKKLGSDTIDALPETMRPYAESAMEAYHKARKAHTYLKEANTDAKRAAIRRELLKHIENNKRDWAVVDAFLKDGTLPQELIPTAAKELKVVPQHVMNAKSSLSKALAALEKNPPAKKAELLKEKIKGLLTEFKASEHEPNEKVQARLRDLGLL